MNGDKPHTEAADSPGIRPRGVVGERGWCREAGRERTVERQPVRMQT
jgi:hypothetical protein